MNFKIKQIIWFVTGVLACIGLDQWTKALAVSRLKGQPPFVILDGVFEFFYSENRGAAFGMLQGRQGFFFVIGLVVIAAVIYYLCRGPADRRYWPLTFCVLLIASGAVGNMIDRVTQGYVVDFLYFKLINFPIFNVADCYVTVATAVIIVLFLFHYRDEDLAVFSLRGHDSLQNRDKEE